MAKRNPEPEETRAGIRRAASLLFQYNGVHAASLNDIAAEAGLSKGTLYYHYPTKEQLVLEIAEEHFAQITEVIFAWIDGLDAARPAFDLLLPLTERLLANREGLRLHFALMSEAMREEGELRERLHTKLREWEVMLDVGALKMTGPGAQRFRRYCKSYISLVNGYAMHTLVDEEADLSALLRMLSDV